MQRLKDQLNADEAQDDAEAEPRYHDALRRASTKKNSWRKPISANTLHAKTRNACCVIPKNRGNRVKREHQVRRTEGQDNDEHRRDVGAPAVAEEHAPSR